VCFRTLPYKGGQIGVKWGYGLWVRFNLVSRWARGEGTSWKDALGRERGGLRREKLGNGGGGGVELFPGEGLFLEEGMGEGLGPGQRQGRPAETTGFNRGGKSWGGRSKKEGGGGFFETAANVTKVGLDGWLQTKGNQGGCLVKKGKRGEKKLTGL